MRYSKPYLRIIFESIINFEHIIIVCLNQELISAATQHGLS